jgi:hypothetical protein
MKTANSLTGGETSSFIAVHYPADYEIFSLVCINAPKARPKDGAIVRYVEGKLSRFVDRYGEFIATAEDDRTLQAMMDLEQFIGREIIWVRGASFEDVIDKPRVNNSAPSRLPSWAARYCTDQMKIYPIFEWWLQHLDGAKVKMRIGFRLDEYDRMERFVHNPEHARYTIPVSCSIQGKRRRTHQSFDWRFCTFPLIRDGISKKDIDQYWRHQGYVGGNLFEDRRKIEFPVVSNCVGCFHKKPDTLCVMWNQHPEKMQWFADQEEKGKGTWLESGMTYSQLGIHALRTPYIEEMIRESGAACDSGGCTD